MKKAWNLLWPYITAAGICIVLILVHCLTRGIWLFDHNKTLLAGDASAQYIYYMSELWHKLHNGGSLFFTWNMEMGADAYYNMFGYVLLPLHIIVWLLPWEWLETSVQIVMVLRFAMMAVSIVFYVLHTERNKITEKKELLAVLMGVCFTFSGIMVYNFIQITWWTTYIIFPLLVLAFERFIDHGKWKLYYFLLTVLMFYNVYLAYTICLFLVIYFFLQEFDGLKDFFSKGIRFAGVSLLSALTATLVILPSIAGMFSRYTGSENRVYDERLDRTVANIWQWINGSYMYNSIEEIYDLSPHVYMGMIFGIVLAVYIFLPINKKVKIKRIIMGIAVGSGFFIVPISRVWHAFVIPNGYYFRFSMIWIFYCIYIFMEAVPYISELRIRWIACAVVIVSAMYIIEFFKETDLREAYIYLIMILLFVFYISLIVLFRRKSITVKVFLTILTIVTLIEVSSNAYVMFKDITHYRISNVAYNRFADDLIQKIDTSNGERVMITNTDIDYGLWNGTKSVNGFASVSNHGIMRLLTQLGLSQFASETGVDCRGGTPLINFMLDIKYGIGLFEGAFSDVEAVGDSGDLTLFQMQHPSYLGYMVDDDILDWNFDEDVLFEGQNNFVKKAAGEDSFMTVLPRTGTVQVDYGFLKEQDNGDYNFVLSSDSGGVMMTYVVPDDMDLYIYSYANKQYGFRQLKVDGEIIFNDVEYRTIGTIHVGKVKKGQTVTLMQILTGYMGEDVTFRYQIASFDEDKYEQIYNKLTKTTYNVTQFEDAYIKGDIDVESEGIMMTSVPVKDGFSVYVDGDEIEYKAIANAFIGVPLKPGKHVVEFRYISPYVIEGALCSCFGFIFFIIVCVLENRLKDNAKA
ncbi:MAG: YfhO family protein [Lachnospiraceae bacterium]|nr:YfhO family protein [Lachnospiraceae bacterium]